MKELEQYRYDIPTELIAHEPAEPRDSARLLVYDTATDEVSFKHVSDLPELLSQAHFIYNDTTVLPARLQGVGEEDKSVELLVLVDQGVSDDGVVRVLVNRFTKIGEEIRVGDSQFEVLENKDKSMLMRYSGGREQLLALLQATGETPLPPYIHSSVDEVTKRTQYQTMFAKNEPSVAAPTASLHFTPELLARMEAAGATFSPVTLQVGLGTFAPIFAENFASKSLHTEFYSVPKETAEAIVASKQVGVPVVAIGTTVVRTLESAREQIQKGEGVVEDTDIFIFPPYQFSVPDIMLTNFHVPQSSLMCLVDAFLEDKGAKRNVMDLYKIAIGEKFRFYSFGDAMLIT